ncbi:hypothetical protein [Clostridium sp.]|uniref:hypothetical protein n=1 Tax=Clostridium sp. TaxID=1506 RepID=UPI0025BF8D8F|nr:hypothetical protein [Clostridium sp.]
MGYGFLLIFVGLILIFLQKTTWHKNYIIKHKFSELDDFFRLIRNAIGVIFILMGIVILFI